jgi:hypothetical protein
MLRLLRVSGLALGLLATCPAMATDPWTRQDTYWELAYVGMVALDCNQSSQIQALGRTERNPFLPRRPSPRTMQAICLGSVVGHAAVSYVLPGKWRRGFQTVTFTLETAVVVDNYFRAGIRFKF